MNFLADNLILGMRFGVPILLGVFVLFVIIMVCFGYIKYIQKKTLTWSDIFLGALSNFISPCVIQHQTSGMIAYFSSFVIMKLTILMTVFLTILHTDPSIWNSSSHFKGTKFKFLTTCKIYIFDLF